ncbi:hypothetical protein DPMN_136503 [Dreissena polymorpha]|uniref:Uncharacterized protein n=1 Tax=Dreissena polymorpha TaxID=45954 RepID=A0A9D4G101_DREPO|nr:hypothetical protein DPMN_136503 [Dreissena polymorpha]
MGDGLGGGYCRMSGNRNYLFCPGKDIIGTNILTKVLTRTKAPLPPFGSCFQSTGTMFKIIQDIIGTNLLTTFHEDRTINVASKVLTEKCPSPMRPYFSTSLNHFSTRPRYHWANLLSKFREEPTINEASRVLSRKFAMPLEGHVFQQTIFFFLNVLTKFHDDKTLNETFRALTRKNASPTGGNMFCNQLQPKLIQDTIWTNLLTKFHEDQTINVDSIVLTRQMLTMHD